MVDLFPYALELFNIQGAENVAQKNYDEAIDSYRQALKIKPNFSENHYNMGIVLHGKGDVGAALQSYKRALKINPAHAKSHINLGIIYKNRGEFSAAIVSYKKALEIKPKFAKVWNVLAHSLQATKLGTLSVNSQLNSSLEEINSILCQNRKIYSSIPVKSRKPVSRKFPA